MKISDLLSSRTQNLPVELPDFGKSVLAIVQHFDSKNQRYAVLMSVDADDHTWVICDDESELSYSWDVISWIYLPELGI